MTTGKCPGCPRTKPGICFAEEFGLRHFCAWRAAGDHSHDSVLKGDVEPTRVESSGAPPQPTALAIPRPVPTDLATARLAVRCPHRSKGVDGCRPHACAAARGDGCDRKFTSWENCLRCVASDSPSPSPSNETTPAAR